MIKRNPACELSLRRRIAGDRKVDLAEFFRQAFQRFGLRCGGYWRKHRGKNAKRSQGTEQQTVDRWHRCLLFWRAGIRYAGENVGQSSLRLKRYHHPYREFESNF